MLLELRISNFAVIDKLHIPFKPGLNIISGETGAGKSVLLKGLALLMGVKGSSDIIRHGSDRAEVEGLFDLHSRPDVIDRLAELGISTEEKLLAVKRTIMDEKSRVYLNGSISSLNQLREVISPLIEINGHYAPLIEMTGQHENRNLLSPNYHLELLDLYAQVGGLRGEYQKVYTAWSQAKKELDQLKESLQSRAQRLDYLEYQIAEIKKLNLTVGEEETLTQDIQKLKGRAKAFEFVQFAQGVLVDGDESVLRQLKLLLNKTKTNEAITGLELNEKVEALCTQAEDLAYEISKSLKGTEESENRLDELESRLSDLRKVQKKFGKSLDEVLLAQAGLETELNQLKQADDRMKSLRSEIQKFELTLKEKAKKLGEIRRSQAVELSRLVNIELKDLNMKGVQFSVLTCEAENFGPTGKDTIEFQTQMGQEQAKGIAKVASGGELSRILLSLKQVIGSGREERTFLFDEVDTGVSGPTAEKVGKKLRSISKGHQVILVTHLPQVAAYGNSHFLISKKLVKDRAQSEVIELTSQERIQEIARLISGEKITKTSLEHAESLLQQASP